MVSKESFDKLVERTATLEILVLDLIKWTRYDYVTDNLPAQQIAVNRMSQDKSKDVEGSCSSADPDKQPLMTRVVEDEERPECPNVDELTNKDSSDMDCISKDDEDESDLESFFCKFDCMPGAVNAANPVSHNKSKEEGRPSCDQVQNLPNVVEDRPPVLVCPNFDDDEATPVDIDITDDQVNAVEIEIRDLEVDEHENIQHQVDNDTQSDVQDMDDRNEDMMDFEVHAGNENVDEDVDVEEENEDDAIVDSSDDSDLISSSGDDGEVDDEKDETWNPGMSVQKGSLLIARKKRLPKRKPTRPPKRRLESNKCRPRPFPCTKCGKSFNHKHVLIEHDKVIHLGLKDFSCAQCEKKFPTQRDLTRHTEAIHLGIRHPCPNCNKMIRYEHHLPRHLNTCRFRV